MKNIKLSVILVFSMMLLLTGCGNKDVSEKPVEVKAAKTQEVIQEKKVVAGTVMAAELLDLLEVDLVGIPSTKKGLPKRYEGVTEIGMPMKPDLEKIVSLDPDIFVSDATLKEAVDGLLGDKEMELVYMNNNSYEDLETTITSLGEKFNKEDKAKEVVDNMKEKEKEILKSIEGKESPRVMVIFGTTESFMLATNNSFVGSLVEKLGATNVTDELSKGAPAPYVPFSLEQAVALNPDIILRLTHMEVEASKAAFDQEFSKGLWQNMKTVKEDKVYDLDPEYFGVTANSRSSESLEKLAEILYK